MVYELLDKAKSLYLEGKYEEAITLYDRVLEIDPGNVLTLNSNALALVGFGKYEEAITLYDRVLEIDPGNVDTLYNKGAALYKLDK